MSVFLYVFLKPFIAFVFFLAAKLISIPLLKAIPPGRIKNALTRSVIRDSWRSKPR